MKYIELVKGLFTSKHEERTKQEEPYVAYSKEAGKFMFTIAPERYVTFTAELDSSSIGLTRLSTGQIMEYSMDTTIWNTFDTTTNISLNNGDKVYVRGVLSSDNTNSDLTQFKMSGKISASGNCNAIWNYRDLNTPLKKYCGYYMFGKCTSLITAPELPATMLADNCYKSMFWGCYGLITAPELPATQLNIYCYYNMFYGCTSLTTPPALPATELSSNCYYLMFYNCASLVTAPELPALTLVGYCYYNMFNGCTKLSYIKCLATDLSGLKCTNGWASGVSSTGTFIKHPDMNNWLRDLSYGIPKGWTVEDAAL